MSDINSLTIVGRLTRDPEVKYTSGGKALGNISIASNHGYGDKQDVSYFDVEVWENKAIACEKYLKKGDQVMVQGYLKQKKWQTQNGENRYKIVIVCIQIQFPSRSNSDSQKDYQNFQTSNPYSQPQQSNQQYQQRQQPVQQQFQKPQQTQNPGFIEDPWGDSNGDDDIPF